MYKEPVFISLFLLVFAAFWTVVCGFVAWVGGWYQFAKKHVLPDHQEVIRSYNFTSIQFNTMGSYNNSINLSLHREGISMRPLLLFRAFHSPFFIYWKEILEIKQGKEFFWFPVADVYVDGNRIRFYGQAMKGLLQEYSAWKQRS